MTMPDLKIGQADAPATRGHCTFCGHDNPAGSKYCNECAADLQLALCPASAAVNRRDMPQCHKCGAALATARDDDLPAPPAMNAVPITAPPPPAKRHRAAGAVVMLVAIVAAAYAAVRLEGDMPSMFAAQVPAPAPAASAPDDVALPKAVDERPPVPAPVAAPPPVASPEPRSEPAPAPQSAQVEPVPPPTQESIANPRPAAACSDAVAALALCNRPDERK